MFAENKKPPILLVDDILISGKETGKGLVSNTIKPFVSVTPVTNTMNRKHVQHIPRANQVQDKLNESKSATTSTPFHRHSKLRKNDFDNASPILQENHNAIQRQQFKITNLQRRRPPVATETLSNSKKNLYSLYKTNKSVTDTKACDIEVTLEKKPFTEKQEEKFNKLEVEVLPLSRSSNASEGYVNIGVASSTNMNLPKRMSINRKSVSLNKCNTEHNFISGNQLNSENCGQQKTLHEQLTRNNSTCMNRSTPVDLSQKPSCYQSSSNMLLSQQFTGSEAKLIQKKTYGFSDTFNFKESKDISLLNKGISKSEKETLATLNFGEVGLEDNCANNEKNQNKTIFIERNPIRNIYEEKEVLKDKNLDKGQTLYNNINRCKMNPIEVNKVEMELSKSPINTYNKNTATKVSKIRTRNKVLKKTGDYHPKESLLQESGHLKKNCNKNTASKILKVTKKNVKCDTVNLNNIVKGDNIQRQCITKTYDTKLESKINDRESVNKEYKVITNDCIDSVMETIEYVIKQYTVNDDNAVVLNASHKEEQKNIFENKKEGCLLESKHKMTKIGLKKNVVSESVKGSIEYVINDYKSKHDDQLKVNASHKEKQGSLFENKEEISSAENKHEMAGKGLEKTEGSVFSVQQKRKTVIEFGDRSKPNDHDCDVQEQNLPKKVRIRLATENNNKVIPTVERKEVEIIHVSDSEETIGQILKKYNPNFLESTLRIELCVKGADDVEFSESSRYSDTEILQQSEQQYLCQPVEANKRKAGIPFFSAPNPRVHEVATGVTYCTSLVVRNTMCGGHIWIEPEQCFEKLSSNHMMYTVQSGIAIVEISKTWKVIDTNVSFFIPCNTNHKIVNRGPKKITLCFMKIAIGKERGSRYSGRAIPEQSEQQYLSQTAKKANKREAGKPIFSGPNPRVKTLTPGVSSCRSIIVDNTICGGHIWIEPGKSYEKLSANHMIYTVQSGTANIQIPNAKIAVDENSFFFICGDYSHKVINQGEENLTLCFMKIPVGLNRVGL